ncbi:GNAT family N-acetyltransferase [Candidatus Bipolaricaulota bacterium]|nr:GNAT family N-acetyltransferase [Candidatus Bipolaricaulota bacterium]
MTNQGEIRNASLADADSIAKLSVQLGYPSSAQQTIKRLSKILGSREHLVLVACLPDHIVIGWMHVFIALRVESNPFAEIGGFGVAEELRGRGVGRSLLEAADKWVKDHGIAKMRVCTRSTRSDAQGFYQRLGFIQTKEQHVYDRAIDSAN